jgi:hypothetical protein
VTVEQVEDVQSGSCTRLRVERRADPLRREGHVPPVIVEVQSVEAETLAELQAIAASNVSLAQRILRWQQRRAQGGGPT